MTALPLPTLKVFLLGPPHIELAGRAVIVQRRKVLGLLAYLVVSGTPQRRDSLAAFFWPESSRQQRPHRAQSSLLHPKTTPWCTMVYARAGRDRCVS